jgi:hypothetical protein
VWVLAVWSRVPLAGVLGNDTAKNGQTVRGDSESHALPLGAISRLGTVNPQLNVSSISLTFLPDNQTLITTGPYRKEGQVTVWNARTGKVVRRLEGHSIADVAPNGRIIATREGPKEKVLCILDVQTGKELSRVPRTDRWGFYTDSCFSPDSRFLAVGGGTDNNRWDDDPPLRLWETATGKEAREFPLRALLQALSFSPDGKTLATVKFTQGVGKTIQLWDVATAKEIGFFKDRRVRGVSALAFSPDSTSLALVGHAPDVLLWDVRTDKERWRIRALTEWVSSVAFSPDGQTLAIGTGNKGTVYLLEAATGGERCRFQGHLDRVFAVAFSPNGQLLASAGSDGAPIVWDVTGRILGAGQKVKLLDAKELDAAWSDLSDKDAAKAWQAIRALVVRPEQAVPLLKEHLPANSPLDPKRLAALLADLDSDSFDTREKAAKELEALGDAVVPSLRKLLAATTSAEVRARVETILRKIPPDDLRTARAIEVLEYAATPEARKLLEEKAKGATESQLTKGAKAAIDRLAKKR